MSLDPTAPVNKMRSDRLVLRRYGDSSTAIQVFSSTDPDLHQVALLCSLDRHSVAISALLHRTQLKAEPRYGQ